LAGRALAGRALAASVLATSVLATSVLVALGFVSAGASADVSLPPWSDHALVDHARSVRVLKSDEPMRSSPARHAKRRGSARRDSRLPLFGARRGPGCDKPWLHVGPQAWMCADGVELLSAKPMPVGWQPRRSTPDGLPFRYFFVSRDGSLAYEQVEQVDIGEPAMQLDPGFAVAVVEKRVLAGEEYGLTNRGLWLPMRDLGPARSFLFRGAEVDEDALIDTPDGKVLPFGWVVVDRASVFRRVSNGFVRSGDSLLRFDQVGWHEEAASYGHRFVRIDESRWLRRHDIRHPTIAAPPEEVAAEHGERWIDVELSSQTLVAFEGRRPVFATLVSTGKGKTQGHPFETPKGVHRVWVKLVSAVMDNLEDEGASSYYRIEDVPYVQYFSKGVGLHAAFWHRSFGRVRSHGCVNLAPLDAQRLFWWTGPHLPTGWTAVLPTSYEKGTLIRVR